MPRGTYTFSYYNVDPENDENDIVSPIRFLIGDTSLEWFNDEDGSLEIPDEIITAYYNQTPSGDTKTQRVYVAAYECARYQLTKYRRQVTFSSAGLSVNLSDRIAHYENVVTDLAIRAQNAYCQSAGYAAYRKSTFID